MFAAILACILFVAVPTASAPSDVYHEQCVISSVAAVDDTTDLVTVITGEGEEYAFYADSSSFSSAQCVDVTFTIDGEIVDAGENNEG